VALLITEKGVRGSAMMNLIQTFLSKDRSSKAHIRNQFIAYFYSLPEHQWILETCQKQHFDKLFSHLPANLLQKLMTSDPIIFVPIEKLKERDAAGSFFANTIVVFPQFQNLLRSKKQAAVAYLAHEIAFILLELEGAKEDPIMAEVAADRFVSDLGLTYELEELLLMLDETIEKRLRLTYLTINHFRDA
jgi:hypothetical protein